MRASWATVRTVIASCWTWGILTVLVTLFFPFIMLWRIVGWPFDRWNYIGGRLFRIAGALAGRLTPRWHFSVRGALPANPRLPYVVVSNHESVADILLICLLPWEMKWLGKEQLFKIPFLGWMMWLAGDIPVRRGTRESIVAAMNDCRDKLKQRLSVMIFPEGTRTPDGALLPFKDGAFRLAIENSVPILPIVVAGTRRAMAKHTFQFQKTRAICRVLEPIETAELTLADLQVLKQRTRDAIAAAKERLHTELGLSDSGEPIALGGQSA